MTPAARLFGIANLWSFLQAYDYVVVGAGSAGSVVAARLSEDAGVTVAVVEDGGHETVLSEVPGLAGDLQLSQMDWRYRASPSSTTCLAMKNRRSFIHVTILFPTLSNHHLFPPRTLLFSSIHHGAYHRCNLPRGHVVGGSSSINYMIYVRGNRLDYDHWESLGNSGWGFRSVLPFFMKSEGNTDPSADLSRCYIPFSASFRLYIFEPLGYQCCYRGCLRLSNFLRIYKTSGTIPWQIITGRRGR